MLPITEHLALWIRAGAVPPRAHHCKVSGNALLPLHLCVISFSVALQVFSLDGGMAEKVSGALERLASFRLVSERVLDPGMISFYTALYWELSVGDAAIHFYLAVAHPANLARRSIAMCMAGFAVLMGL